MLNTLMKKQSFSIYRLAKESHVPYMTLNDICSNKTRLEKCSADTIYKLAKALKVSMEELLSPYMEHRCSFDLFKSNICHRVRENEVDFLIEVLEKDEIRKFHIRAWHAECLYLLAMVDYLSQKHELPLCDRYNDLRKTKLKNPLFPASVLAQAAVSDKSEEIKKEAIRNAIPEFVRFNIIESEIYNVI